MRPWKLITLLMLVFMIGLVACQSGAETPAPTAQPAVVEEPVTVEETVAPEPVVEEPAPELEVTDIKLGFGVDAVFAPHIVAIKKGWFEEAGFTSVETPSFSAGALAGEALAAGEIQLWTPGNVPPISMIHNGMPIVIVGINTDAYIEKLVVRTDAGVETPEDLYEIKIGLLQGSTASAVLARIASQYGLDVTQMQVVNLPPPEQLTSMINNDTQAMLVWNPWPYQAQDEAAMEVEILHNGTKANFAWDQSEYQASNTLSLWVMPEAFIRESPNSARALFNVLMRGQEYVRDPANRDEVINMVAEWNGQPVELVEAMWNDYGFNGTLSDAYITDMQAYTDFLQSDGRIESPRDPLSYTYTGFLSDYNADYAQVQGQWMP